MERTSERAWESRSFWGTPESHDITDLPVRADTIVVGAGVAGLSVAYELLGLGHFVVVLDKGAVGGGQTGRSTAHLCDALDDRYLMLERVHGVSGAKRAAASHRAAIASIERVVRLEQIACGFGYLDGYLFESEAVHSSDFLEQECKAARRAGVDVEVDATGMADRLSSAAVLRFARQAQLDPLAYVKGLAAAVKRRGGVIGEGRLVRAVERSGSEWQVQLEGGLRMLGKHLVVATNVPINDTLAIHTKQAAYRSYVIAFRADPTVLPAALLWDTAEPYHYLRWADPQTLLVGGADHRVGLEPNPESCWDQLERWTRARFSEVGEVVSRWSGQIVEPVDGLAYIGKNPGAGENCFVVTGDSGNGMTHGTLAGALIRDLVAGVKNEWTSLYEPSRKPINPHALKKYLWENTKVAVAYGDWLKLGSRHESAIAIGSGDVVQRGAHKLAVYVDDDGGRHECSAVCPHLGGIVHWNAAEHSWDCPCHGSRFDALGHVLAGPASTDLASVTS
ncbi:MAG: FAD-dependent oxidoreductase [Myxococcales bacterium]